MFILTPILISVAYADIQIQHIVPDTTIVVVSMNNVGNVIDHMKSSGICETLCDATSLLYKNENQEKFSIEDSWFTSILASMDVDIDSLAPPTGHAGIAIYPVVDYESGSVEIGFFGLIELDESTYGEVFSENIEKVLEESKVQSESVRISGRDVWMIELDFTSGIPIELVNDNGTSFNRAYISFNDGYLFFGTEPDAFGATFDVIDGDSIDDPLADHPDYLAMLDRCGSGEDVFAAVLLTNLADTVVQMDETGMAMMFLPSLKAMFGDIDGIAESVHISPSEDILVEATYTLLMNDGRSGLLGLIGENADLQQIPVFVQSDAVTYSQGKIDLDKVVPLIKETILNNPMIGMQMAPYMEDMENGFALFLNPLGSTYHTYSTGQLPFDAETVGYLIAIECKDEEAFGSTLSLTLPAFGAVPADFLGNQIFTVDIGANLPMAVQFPLEISIAVGGGYAFFGSTHTVEHALRSISNPKENKGVQVSNPAATLLSNDDVSAWGYSDLKKSIEIQTAMRNAISENMLEEMEAYDPEMGAEMRAEFEQSSFIQTVISDMITSLLGPMAWNMSVDDSGFIAHGIMLHSNSE